MKLVPLDNAEIIELVAGWMAEEENFRWLDFGNGTQILSPVAIKIMTQRDIHVVRVFMSDADDVPIGVVGFTNVQRLFKTATIWFLLGDKRYRGATNLAVSKMLSLGFGEMGLWAINAWAVESNVRSIRLLERLNFRLIGRQRQCHYIDGRPYDRLLYDIIAPEHKEIDHTGAHVNP